MAMTAAGTIFRWAGTSIRDRGLVQTCQLVLSIVEDTLFDYRFGTETGRAVNTDQLETASPNRWRAVRYQATKARPFVRLLRCLQLPHGVTFVDVGCGKGKVLLLAARHPFKRVVGIEFSPALSHQARQNIEIFRRRCELISPIDIHTEDATLYGFHGDENVIFLYNPFDAAVLSAFLKNLQASAALHPRPIWLIYGAPVHAEVVEGCGLFSSRQSFNLSGSTYYVYTSGLLADRRNATVS